MRIRRSLASMATGSLLLLALCASAGASPFQAFVDEFWIVKNGTEIYRDSFNGGGVPPAGPDGPQSYGTGGDAGFTGQSNGVLTITPSLGSLPVNSAVAAERHTTALRRLAVNPTIDATAFLGQVAAFEIHGLFGLASLPTILAQGFGIGLNDVTGISQGNDHVWLSLQRSFQTNELGVRLFEQDDLANSIETAGFDSIENWLPLASQLELIVSKTAGSDEVGGGYRLLDANGNLLHAKTVDNIGNRSGQPLRVYEGENFTRAFFGAFDASSNAVPLPSTLALTAAGLALLWAGRRRKSLY